MTLNEQIVQLQDELSTARNNLGEQGAIIRAIRDALRWGPETASAYGITDTRESAFPEFCVALMARFDAMTTELDGLRLRARASGLGPSPVQPFAKPPITPSHH